MVSVIVQVNSCYQLWDCFHGWYLWPGGRQPMKVSIDKRELSSSEQDERFLSREGPEKLVSSTFVSEHLSDL